MSPNRFRIISMSVIILCCICLYPLFAYQIFEECTVGVASGRATPDGRPLIWKTRDAGAVNNEVFYNTSGKYKYIAVFNAGDTKSPWMGVNEKGFAILNSLSRDLCGNGNTGQFMENGTFMHIALNKCANVIEFQSLLDRRNIKGRKTCANYFVLDASGAAAIFETTNSVYWKFDAMDEEVAPDGYILRTNFAFNGGGTGGIERYRRTTSLMKDFYDSDKICHKEILRTQMRDFVDAENNPIELPFGQNWVPSSPHGYVQCNNSICRPSSVSAAVIQGVLPGEDPLLSTMWTMLGQPTASITVPYWPVGVPPDLTDGEKTAPLCDISLKIKSLLFDYVIMEEGKRTKTSQMYIDTYKIKDEYGKGVWEIIFPVEDIILEEAEGLIEMWRREGANAEQMLEAEAKFASKAYEALEVVYKKLENSDKN